MTLLDGRFAPLTLSWGFLEKSLEESWRVHESWRAENFGPIESVLLDGSLDVLLRNLEPLTVPKTRELLAETQSDWTAYFDNSANGGDPPSTIAFLCRRLACRGLAVSCRPHLVKTEGRQERGLQGSIKFQLFSAEDKEFLNYERSLAVTYDGSKWVFVSTGRIQPFESPEKYRERRVVDRFTPEMLLSYCHALGIDLFNAGFYGPRAYLVAQKGNLPEGHPILTLEEARVRLGIC